MRIAPQERVFRECGVPVWCGVVLMRADGAWSERLLGAARSTKSSSVIGRANGWPCACGIGEESRDRLRRVSSAWKLHLGRRDNFSTRRNAGAAEAFVWTCINEEKQRETARNISTAFVFE